MGFSYNGSNLAADNMSTAQKLPFARNMNAFAERKVNDAFQQLGKALPCSVVSVSGQIVTVKFEIQSNFTLPNVTIPIYGAEYIRFPTQVGDKGMCFPADARLDQMSGIGSGVADLSQPGNLTALVFLPIGNKGWAASDDPQAVVIYGPNGVILRDTTKQSTVTISKTGIAMQSVGTVKMQGNGLTAAAGVVQGGCLCAYTGAPHPQVSTSVQASI